MMSEAPPLERSMGNLRAQYGMRCRVLILFQRTSGIWSLDDSAPFVQPVSRVLQQVGSLAAELVGAQQLQVPVKGIDPYSPERGQSIESAIQNLAEWYESHLVPNIEGALARTRDGNHS